MCGFQVAGRLGKLRLWAGHRKGSLRRLWLAGWMAASVRDLSLCSINIQKSTGPKTSGGGDCVLLKSRLMFRAAACTQQKTHNPASQALQPGCHPVPVVLRCGQRPREKGGLPRHSPDSPGSAGSPCSARVAPGTKITNLPSRPPPSLLPPLPRTRTPTPVPSASLAIPRCQIPPFFAG